MEATPARSAVEGIGNAATPSGRRKWFGLIAISVAVSLIIVDSTIVNVAIPYVVKDLQIDSVQVQWVQEIYTLVFAATLLIWGNLADRWGRRRVLMVGVALFAAASLLAALASSGDLLIAARMVQGLGGAIILPTSLSLINATFQGRDRGIAFAIWGSTIGGMAAVGPLLGGWLTTDFSWRWAFGINIPLGVVIAIGVIIFVDESRAPREGGIDALGAVLSAIACAALVYGLIEGRQEGWWTTTPGFAIGTWKWPLDVSPIPFIFAIAVVSAFIFVVRGQRRSMQGKATIIAFTLFRITSFRNGNLAAMIVSLGEFGIIVSLPIWLQNVLGYTALQTGFVLLALAIGSFVASGLSATVGQRLNRVTIVRIGLIAEIAGLGGVGLVVGPNTSWVGLVPFLFVYGFGVGLATAQLTGVVLKDVPVERSGEGSGTSSLARQIGSALGIAILGTILFSTASTQLTSALEKQGVSHQQQHQLVDSVVNSSGGVIGALEGNPATDAAAADAKEAFSNGTRYSAFAAAGFLTIGLLATVSWARHRSVEGGMMAQPSQQSFRSNNELLQSNQAMAQSVRTAELIPYRDGGYVSRVVEIRGRLTGRIYEVPLAVITVFGGNYVVSPSADRNWVRNLTGSPNCMVVSREAREHRYAVRVIDRARATEVTSTYLSLMDAPWDVAQFPFTSDTSISETVAGLDQLAVFELTQSRSPVLSSLTAH